MDIDKIDNIIESKWRDFRDNTLIGGIIYFLGGYAFVIVIILILVKIVSLF